MVFFTVAPQFMTEYQLWILTIFCINIILVTSFRLITTMGGWSFTHTICMGVGGYTTALLTTKFLHLPFWLTLPLGGLAAALFALAISYPVLRTKGFYFFISTYAAGEAMRQVWIKFRNIFGGHWGIGRIVKPSLLGINFADPHVYYYLVLAFVALSLLIMYRFDKSRLGDTIKATSMSDSLCESMGINTRRYETIVFVMGSFFAGIAGVLYVHYTGIVTPHDFSGIYMFNVLTWAIVGGTGSFAGPVMGLSLMTGIAEIFRHYKQWVPLINGLFIVGILLFLPEGIQSLPQRIRRHIHRNSPLLGGGTQTVVRE